MTKILDIHGNEIKTAKAVTTKGRIINNTGAIIDKIVSQFKDQSRKDIDKWRAATLLANDKDKPRRDLFFSLIDDLKTDGHLESQITLRKASVLNTEFQITNEAGDIDEEKTKLIRSKWFYDILDILAETPIFGHSLIEFYSLEGTKIKTNLIPRGNVVPVKRYIIPDLSKADEVIYYNTPAFEPWLVEFGKFDDLGLINKIVPNLIWKRNMMQSWAEFAEKFGIPLVTATTQRYDDDTLDKVEGMLEQLGEASYAVFPEGTVLEMKEADRADATGVYDNKIERNNGEISKAITGSTMISDDGSSRSQAEVHERNLDDKIAPADRRNVEFVINEQLLPLLTLYGYPFAETDRFSFNHTQTLTVKEQWDITKELLATHEIPEEWISKTFSIPITGKKKVETKLNDAINIQGLTLPTYVDGSCPNCGGTTEQFSAVVNNAEIKRLEAQLWEALYNSNETLPIESKLVVEEATQLLKGLQSGWGKRATEVSYTEPDILTLALMEQNAIEFAMSKTNARKLTGENLFKDREKLKLNTFSEFKKAVESKTKNFNAGWFKTEYNLAIATGQNSATYFRALSEKDHIPYLKYITAGDSNVRSTHEQLDGKIFTIADASKVMPPNDYGCRCMMEQYPHTPSKELIMNGNDGKNTLKLAKDFAINRTAEKVIFVPRQFYSNMDSLKRKLNNLTFDKLKLETYTKIMKSKNPLKLDESINKKNYKELFTINNKEGMELSDYNKRKLIIHENTFNKNTNYQLFPHVKDVIYTADEVWLKTNGDKSQMTYIKYYSDVVLLVNAKMTQFGFEIIKWQEMTANENIVRSGLRIK